MSFTDPEIGAVGLTGAAYRAYYGTAGAGLTIPTFPALEVPVLSAIPVIGDALLAQPVTTYLAVACVPLTWWFLFRTRAGLAMRAAGESAEGARAAGVRVRAARTTAVIVGGAFAGAAGATLVLAQVGTFAEKMTAGRGFIAIAIVVLGRWHPAGVLPVPYQLFIMLPYVLALLGLAGAVGRVRAPRDLGRAEGFGA